MKSPAKINLFLKIIGTRGAYHEIASRFWRVDSLFDELFWIEGASGFFVDSSVSCEMQKNSVYRAKEALLPYLKETQAREIERLGVRILKRIPEGAGLGGGSSNAATFLKMAYERFGLTLSTAELAEIGAKIGADVPFFIFGYKSANVRGIGEIVEEFCEEPCALELFTPPLHIDTSAVYRTFRERVLPELDLKKQAELSERLLELSGVEIAGFRAFAHQFRQDEILEESTEQKPHFLHAPAISRDTFLRVKAPFLHLQNQNSMPLPADSSGFCASGDEKNALDSLSERALFERLLMDSWRYENFGALSEESSAKFHADFLKSAQKEACAMSVDSSCRAVVKDCGADSSHRASCAKESDAGGVDSLYPTFKDKGADSLNHESYAKGLDIKGADSSHLFAKPQESTAFLRQESASKNPYKTLANPHAFALNDLYVSALLNYPELTDFARKGWWFSGSGSTFFRLSGALDG